MGTTSRRERGLLARSVAVLDLAAVHASAARGELRQALYRNRRRRIIQRLLRRQFLQHRQGEAQRLVVSFDPGP